MIQYWKQGCGPWNFHEEITYVDTLEELTVTMAAEGRARPHITTTLEMLVKALCTDTN